VHNLRVHVTRVVDKLTPRARPVEVGNAAAARTGDRMVVFPSAGPDPITTSLYDRALLVPGDQLTGPAVIAAQESTIVVPPDTHVEIDTYGTMLLTLK
jgi:N-methylhydantoinase A